MDYLSCFERSVDFFFGGFTCSAALSASSGFNGCMDTRLSLHPLFLSFFSRFTIRLLEV